MPPFVFPTGLITHDAYKAMLLQLDPDDDDAEWAIRKAQDKRVAKKLRKILKQSGKRFREYLPEEMEADMGNIMSAYRQSSALSRRELEDALQQALQQGADLGVSAAVEQFENIGFAFDWTMAHAEARDWAEQHAGQLIRDLDATTERLVKQSVSRWINNGEHLDVLKEELRLNPAFSNARADMIATTETTRAFSEGNRISYQASGVVEIIEWRTSMDEKVCPICGEMEGKHGTLQDGFNEKAYSGFPPAHVNCRCGFAPIVETRREREARAEQERKQ